MGREAISRETTGSHESLTNFVNDIRAFERNEVGG